MAARHSRIWTSETGRIAERVILAVVGGYWLVSGLATVSVVALTHAFDPWMSLLSVLMVGITAYPAVLIWAFAERQRPVMWSVLGLGGACGMLVTLGLA